jgi:hypothetical protein
MVARGWTREDVQRITTTAPLAPAAYPYVASVRVDKREVYRVHADLAEVLDGEVLDDVDAALSRRR